MTAATVFRSIPGHLRTRRKGKLRSHAQDKEANMRLLHSFEHLGIAQ
jgi:hypothetical protein